MNTSTLTLTSFLLARIAEDEAWAGATASPVQALGRTDTTQGRARARFVASWQPARVLAECEAKRRIVEALVDAERAVVGYDNDDPNNPPSYWQEWGNLHALRLAGEALALPYADHPEYRPEWRL
jgi:hypothetical protein